MKKKQRESVVSAIEKFIDSMVTHLPYCIEVKNPTKATGTRKFAVETSLEYAEEIVKLLKTLK